MIILLPLNLVIFRSKFTVALNSYKTIFMKLEVNQSLIISQLKPTYVFAKISLAKTYPHGLHHLILLNAKIIFIVFCCMQIIAYVCIC